MTAIAPTASAETALPHRMAARRAPADVLDLAAAGLSPASLSPEWVAPVVVGRDDSALRVGVGAALAAGLMAVAGIVIALSAG
jgi:hypothetical protein